MSRFAFTSSIESGSHQVVPGLCFGPLASLLLTVCSVLAQTTRPEATVTLEWAGISAPFTPSALDGRKLTVPHKALFYQGKAEVSGKLILTLPATPEGRRDLRDKPDWSRDFELRSFARTCVPANAADERFQPDEVDIVWGRSAVEEQKDGSVVGMTEFSLKLRDDRPFPPGLYLFLWGFKPNTSFTVTTPEHNASFVVSRFEADEDQLNWYEGMGDAALAQPIPAEATSETAAPRPEVQLEAAALAYDQFLALRPADDRVLLKLAEVRERLRQYGPAARLYRDAAQVWEANQGLKRVVAWRGLSVRGGATWRDFLREVRVHAGRLEQQERSAGRDG